MTRPLLSMKTVELTESIERDKDAIRCECGGYAGEAECTPEEEKKHGCHISGHCCRAFVCGLCQTRYVGKAQAPEWTGR